jgi:hypothetical protein
MTKSSLFILLNFILKNNNKNILSLPMFNREKYAKFRLFDQTHIFFQLFIFNRKNTNNAREEKELNWK